VLYPNAFPEIGNFAFGWSENGGFRTGLATRYSSIPPADRAAVTPLANWMVNQLAEAARAYMHNLESRRARDLRSYQLAETAAFAKAATAHV
jgi:hypothetical protein